MRKKQRNITFRVTDDEYKVIKEKAEKENLTVTDFIVMCCQKREIKPINNKDKNQIKMA